MRTWPEWTPTEYAQHHCQGLGKTALKQGHGKFGSNLVEPLGLQGECARVFVRLAVDEQQWLFDLVSCACAAGAQYN
jgi:hypothetical protein